MVNTELKKFRFSLKNKEYVTICLKRSIIINIPKEVCMNNKWTWVIAAVVVIVILYFVFS